jgi:hypothetical protein
MAIDASVGPDKSISSNLISKIVSTSNIPGRIHAAAATP